MLLGFLFISNQGQADGSRCPQEVIFGQSPGGEITEGQTVEFINESPAADAWQWYVGEELVSIEKDLGYTFEFAGEYAVKLRGFSKVENCWGEYSTLVSVLSAPCPFEASFVIEPNGPWIAGQTLEFFNTSSIGAAWEWSLNGKVMSESENWSYTFEFPGTYTITYRVFSKKYGCWVSYSQTITILDPEPAFCGSDERATPFNPNAGELTFYDRFGNQYALSELYLTDTATGTGVPMAKGASFPGCDCQTEFGINTGQFDLFFEDCNLSTGSGFDDPTASTYMGSPSTVGADRRRTLCQVYADLSAMLPAASTTCNGGTPAKVNVKVEPSAYGSAYPALPADVGGIGSGYISTMGTADGEINVLPLIVYNSGSAPGWMANTYHGKVRFNFHSFPYAWYYGALPVPATQFDFYTVALHESLHMLGFGSYINEFSGGIWGSSLTGTANGGFSGWDAEITKVTGNVDVIDRTAPYAHLLEPSLTLPQDFTQSCQGLGNDLVIGTNSVPLYTGNSFQMGSSLSHLDESCNGATYVMHPALGLGMGKRTLSADEESLLDDLGYSINGSCAVSAGYDLFGACGNVISMSACNNTWYQLYETDLIGNDPNATGIANLEVVSGPVNVGPWFPNTNPFSYYVQSTGGTAGVALLRYQPVGCNGELGNVSYVEIELVACQAVGCEFTGNYPYTNTAATPASNCGTAGNPDCVDCGFNKNPDNLICNPEMCANDYNINFAHQDYHHLVCTVGGGSSNNVGPGFELPGWYRAEETPGYFTASMSQSTSTWTANMPVQIDATSGYLHLGTINSNEAVYTRVSMSPNSRYLMSLYGEGNGWNSGIDLDVVLTNQLYVFNCSYTGGLPNGGPNFQRVWYQRFYGTNVPSGGVNTGTWDRKGTHFTVNNGFSPLAIYFKARYVTGMRMDFLMDNVEIVEDPFTAGPDELKPCPGQPVVLGGPDFEFPMLSDVRVRYVWTEVGSGSVLLDYWTERERNGNYTIYDNLVTSAVTTIPQVTVNPLVNTTYRLTRTFELDPNNTFGGLPANTFSGLQLTDDRVVTVTPGPTATANFTATVNCFAGVFTSDPAETGSSFGHSWDFDSDGNLDAFVANPTFTFPAPGNYTVTHYVTTSCGSVYSTNQVVTVVGGTGGGPLTFPMEIEGTLASTTDFGGALAYGSNGLYVAGLAFGNTQLPQVTGTTPAGNIYVAHYEPNGCGIQWNLDLAANVAFPFNNIEPLDIEVNAADELYLLFNFTGSFTVNSTTYTSAGGVDYAIVKVDAAGQPQYAILGGGTGDDYAHDLEFVGNEIRVVGRINGTTGSFTVGTSTLTYQSVAQTDPDFTPGIGFLANYQDGGTSFTGLWGDDLGAYVVPPRLAVDATGNSYVVANHYASFTFAGATQNPIGGVGVVAYSYGPTGTERWATPLGSIGQDVSRKNNQSLEDIAVNASGVVYVSFDYGTTGLGGTIGAQLAGINASTGGTNWQVQVADAGSWQTTYTNTTVQTSFNGAYTVTRGLALAPNGDVFIAGLFQAGYVDALNSQPTTIAGAGPFSSTNYWNSFVGRYDGAGTAVSGFANVNLPGNPLTQDDAHDMFLMDMVTDASGNLYTSMVLDGTGNLGAAVTGDNYDIFVSRMGTTGTPAYFRAADGDTTPEFASEMQPIEVSLFPNPTEGHIRLQFHDFLQQTGQLIVLDAMGREVMREAIRSSDMEVDMQRLPAGSYIFNIQVGQSISRHRVVKTSR